MKKRTVLAGAVLCLLLAGCARETVPAAEATTENADPAAETTAAAETSEAETSAEPQNPYQDLAGTYRNAEAGVSFTLTMYEEPEPFQEEDPDIVVIGTVELTWANGTVVDGIYLTEPENGVFEASTQVVRGKTFMQFTEEEEGVLQVRFPASPAGSDGVYSRE